MGAPEAAIEDYLVKKSKEHNALCWKFVSPSMDGVPDRIVIYDGHVIFIELKAPGETPRKLQLHVMKLLREHGADARVFDSRAQVDALFKEFSIDSKFNIEKEIQ